MNSAASLIQSLDDERLYELAFRAAEDLYDHDLVISEELVPPIPIRIVLFTCSLDGYMRCSGLKGYLRESLPNHFIPFAFDAIGCSEIAQILRELHRNFPGHEEPTFRIDRVSMEVDKYIKEHPGLSEKIELLDDLYFDTSSDEVLDAVCRFIRRSETELELLYNKIEELFNE